MIKIYSTPTCLYCNTLKEYLRNHNIDFVEVDVSQDEKALEEMVAISDQMGVPVVDINGEIVIGFDKVRIDQILGIK